MMPSKMFRSQFLLVVQWKHLQFDSQHRFEIWHVVFCVAINWPSTFADGPEAITVDAPDWPLHKNKNYPHPSVLVCCCEEQVRKNWFVAQANVNIWLLACLCRSDRPAAWDKTRATKSRAFPLLYAIDPWCHIMNRTESPPTPSPCMNHSTTKLLLWTRMVRTDKVGGVVKEEVDVLLWFGLGVRKVCVGFQVSEEPEYKHAERKTWVCVCVHTLWCGWMNTALSLL